jgi:hypothetical protein
MVPLALSHFVPEEHSHRWCHWHRVILFRRNILLVDLAGRFSFYRAVGTIYFFAF